MLYIRRVEGKGRGVFTDERIRKGEDIEFGPVIVLDEDEIAHVEQTKLEQYIFSWPGDKAAVGFGYLSMYNHDDDPNAHFIVVASESAMLIKAIKDIPADSEIVVDYGNKERFRFIK